jgi:hypothetical protein
MRDGEAGDWEKLTIEPAQGGKVSIRTCHGKWIRAHPDGHLDQSERVEDWESWEPVPIGGGLYNFRSCHGKWLRGHAGDEARADQSEVTEMWERWVIESSGRIEQFYGQPVFLLNVEHNNLLRGHPGGDGACVDTQALENRGDWEKMTITPAGPNKVSIRTSHGEAWIRAHPDGHLDQSPRVEDWESWEPIHIGGGLYNFRSCHGKYMRSHPGGEGSRADQGDNAETWERWTILPGF